MNVLALKHAVRERDGFRCTSCGLTNDEHVARYGKQLHVHRRVPRSRYSIPGCFTVCNLCHGSLPKAEAGTLDPYRSGLSLHVYLKPVLRRTIEAAAEKNRRSLTSEVEIALERYLQAEGLWPPAAEGE